jgi:hypothetical protein
MHDGLGQANDFMSYVDTAGTLQIFVWVNASGFIEVRRTSSTGTLLATSSGHAPITINNWYHILTRVVLSSTAGSVDIRLNDVPVLSFSGVTSSLTSNVAKVTISGKGGFNNGWYDDFYVNDGVDATATQGAANNTYLGDLKVQSLYPTGVGDTTGWTPNTAVANWTTVDETPPNTTDFNFAVATSTGTRDLYNLTDLVGTIAAVLAIRVGLYAQKSDAGAGLIKPVIKETGGTITSQASQGLNTTYAAIWGDPLYVKPSNGAAWTATDVNALQAGVEVG